MSLEIVRNTLLWCTIINFGVLLLWGLLFLFPHRWLFRIWRHWFRLSDEQFEAIVFNGMVFYKVAIILFNLVPYIALGIANSSVSGTG